MTTSMDPKGVETASFFDERNKITAHVLYSPRAEDPFNCDNYRICFRQTKSEDVTLEYSLYYLDKMGEFLCFVADGMREELLYGKKFFKVSAFKQKLLTENEAVNHYMQLDLYKYFKSYRYHINLIEENGSATKTIKIKDVHSFIELVVDVDKGTAAFLAELGKKAGRDIARDRIELARHEKLGEEYNNS